MFNYSNYTQFGIKDKTERYFYACWLTLVILSSLFGDFLILIASTKYKAFKLNKMIVAVIQHMAVNDLLNTVGSIFPILISTIINARSPFRWLDYVRFFIGYYTTTVGSLLISSFTMLKVLLLKYPLRVGMMSKRRTQNICTVIWITSIFVPAEHLIVNIHDVLFDYRTYSYTYGYSSKVWKVLLPFTALIFLVVPNTIVIVSTFMLLYEAKKAVKTHRQTLKWQGITTVALTALVYTVSFFPFIIYFTAEPFVKKNPQNPGPFFLEYYRVTNGLVILHVLSNFFVYSLTVESFRSFLKTKLCGVLTRFLENRVSHQEVMLFTFLEINYREYIKPHLSHELSIRIGATVSIDVKFSAGIP